MSDAAEVNVFRGFSTGNEVLLSTSLLLIPAQAYVGQGTHFPAAFGFLAYNGYQQYTWYIATKNKQPHALFLLPVYLNVIYPLPYLPGIPSGNIVISGFQGVGSATLILMSTISAWTSWKTNMAEGYGVYYFYFCGKRTMPRG